MKKKRILVVYIPLIAILVVIIAGFSYSKQSVQKSISFDGEKTYESIYEGKWITNNKFAVIHRIAVDNNYKGLGLSSKIIKYVEELCLNKDVYSIKIDTHEENISMQKLLEKNDFKYCGIIYLADKSKRVAFEKVLNKNSK